MREGIIVKGIGGFYYVDTSEGIVECHARGNFRSKDILPMVGDSVEIEIDKSGDGSVKKIAKRKNFLIRPAVSNIDSLVIVAAISDPKPDLFLIDKMLVIAHQKGIEGVICINKEDLDDKKETDKIKDAYEKAGYKVFVTSAREETGIDELKTTLKGRITAFAGLSGVGKSSLLTILTGSDLKTGETSKIERGKHTTRHVELIKTDFGYVFDTPGFSQLEIEPMMSDKIKECFPELASREDMCRFRGCIHLSEPGCVVKEAVEAGEIAQSRYDSYVKLYDKLKDVKEWMLKGK